MNEPNKPYILRMYNIPLSKTDTELSQEFLKYSVPFIKVIFTNNVGYALIEFESEQDMNSFAQYFNKLRHDLVIYHS